MRIRALVVVAALLIAHDVSASECTLTLDGEAIEFPHVYARTQPNMIDETKEDVIVLCHREEVPADQRSAEGIRFLFDGRIEIKLSEEGKVTWVMINSDELTASISGLNFGVVFDGARDGRQVRGTIATTKDLFTHFNGEKSDPWRLSATVDVEILD